MLTANQQNKQIKEWVTVTKLITRYAWYALTVAVLWVTHTAF